MLGDQPLLNEYLQEVENTYVEYAPLMMKGWKVSEDVLPFLAFHMPERCASNVLSPSQGKGALSRSHRVEQTSYAVQMRRSLQLAPLKSPRPSLYLTTRQMSSFHSQE